MKYENKRELIKARKHNARLYPIYKMCSWDLLFYNAISFVFLVQVKGFEASQVMFTDAIFPVLKIIFNIPCTMLIDKIGKKRSLVIANIILSMHIISLLFITNVLGLIAAYFLSAIAFSIKRQAESNLLYDSVTQRRGKGMFSKIEEKGTRNYYFLDGISSMLTGFLFIINGYLPIIVSLTFAIISVFITLRFNEIIEIKKIPNLERRVLNYIKEIKSAFKFILRSKRLKALLFFIGIFDGLVYASYTLRETLLNTLVEPEYFALIIAVLTIVSGIFSGLQGKLNKKFKNKTFTFLAYMYVPTFILIGLILKQNVIYPVLLICILILYLIQYAMQAPYFILSSKYIRSFANTKMRDKISGAFELIICIFQFAVALFASLLLDIHSIENNFLIIGIIFIVLITIAIFNMRKKVGLNPEEYTKKDIEVLHPKN